MRDELTLVDAFDAISYAPSPVGTRVAVTLDVSGGGNVIWYEKQPHGRRENYVVWRRIQPPEITPDVISGEDDSMQDIVDQMFGESPRGRDRPSTSYITESEFLAGDVFAETERRFGRIDRIWVYEQI